MDYFSRNTWIYLLKHKSDALSAFKLFKSYVSTQFNGNTKAISSDFGGEFRPFTKVLNEQGIVPILTCPHTSHKNGVVERKHIQFMEMGLTMLEHAFIPISLWDHCFTATTYFVNMLLTSYFYKYNSHFQVLFNKQPEYGTINTFRCACYPLCGPSNKNMLQLKSNKCTYMGVSPTHKGHKCLSLEGGIFISKYVIFIETWFPCKNKLS